MMTDEELQEYRANEAVLDELREIQNAEDESSGEKLSEKVSAMDMTKLEALISQEKDNIDKKTSQYGTDLMDALLWERHLRSPRRSDFRMTDKKYEKFVQINDAFVEAYKLAKEEAEEIVKMLRKRKKNNPSNPLLKEVRDDFYIDIFISPVFYDWDSLFFRRDNLEWRMKNKQLAAKYDFYEALEWVFEKCCLWEIKCCQDGSSHFEQKEKEEEWWDKDPDGNLGPTNWAFNWIPPESKYYWKRRFYYIMHVLADHTFLTMEDILKINRVKVEFKIYFGDIKNKVLVK